MSVSRHVRHSNGAESSVEIRRWNMYELMFRYEIANHLNIQWLKSQHDLMIQLFNDEWMKDLMIERLYEWMNEWTLRRCIYVQAA